MKLTDALLGEHAVLYDLFEYLNEMIANNGSLQEAQRAVSILERVLASHARIEEDLLFPALEPQLGPMGPLAVMRSEHQSIDTLLEAMNREDNIGALNTLVGDLLALARAHFMKEEQVLFPMANQVLDEPTLTTLGEQWSVSRKVVVYGEGCMGAA